MSVPLCEILKSHVDEFVKDGEFEKAEKAIKLYQDNHVWLQHNGNSKR